MKKVSVTYKAAKGDSKVVEAWGCTFYDGKAETVTVSDEYYNEMTGNRFFELGKATDVTDAEYQAEKDKSAKAAESHSVRK
jgi:hypothetical protein